ncbi:glycoside hydrolase family 2 protein [Arachidicoccus ginsenosidivorans]|uniref:Glycoside hydrolase family 2 protein n=2 Tax=Arachidicoccus ginsenosidivorans TaxID=496057 RepID=A0A5B8VRP7_9BACT|nr:glycoside hydrolase family 2 protein [Arachidicoccus ginsenosidivorans]
MVFAALLLTLSGINVYGQNVITRNERKIDADWKFHLGNAASPTLDFNYGINETSFSKAGGANGTAYAIRFNDRNWQKVDLPHDWAVGLPFDYMDNGDQNAHGYKAIGGHYPQNSIGWYRKEFEVDPADSGGRFELRTDGIYRDSKVWVNGYYVGGNYSGYTSATYDITDFIRFGKKNVIAVRVDATHYEGWFYEGAGIYRHVWLNRYNNLHVVSQGGLYVRTENKGKDANVILKTEVINKNTHAVKGTLETLILNREGKVLVHSKVIPLALDINEQKSYNNSLLLPNAQLSNLDNPYLYRAVALVRENGQVVDSVPVRFGVRTFAFDKDKGFFLNGKSVKIKGTSDHQDHAGVGAALLDYLQYYRIGLLKQMGSNAIRTTHNPPTPELLDACDSLGMLVMDETRLLTSGSEYEKEFRDLILRDRNHPSIFLWSIGNEEHYTQRTDIGKRIALNQILLQKELDPSRTATYAANIGNVYHGVNEVIPIRGFNYNLNGADNYHKEHPDQPVIGTEVASTVSTRGIYIKDTVRCYVPDYDSVFPPWASTAETWWSFAAKRDWFMGGFAWTGFDYRGEPTPYKWPNINSHFGIMDMCGFPKTVYYYYNAWWSDSAVMHIAPHWNWQGEEGKEKIVWVNSNTDDVELFLNGKSLGKKKMPINGHLEWKVQYEPGKLEAIGYKDGQKVTYSVETTGRPYQIKLTPSKNVLLADGEDAVVVNVSAVDKQGREVPDASNMVYFDLEGENAAIVGVGNGDPSSHENDKDVRHNWHRSLFNGRAQVIIRSGTNSGTIKLKAFASDVLSSNIELKQINNTAPIK